MDIEDRQMGERYVLLMIHALHGALLEHALWKIFVNMGIVDLSYCNNGGNSFKMAVTSSFLLVY
jgi:hypothetical protein